MNTSLSKRLEILDDRCDLYEKAWRANTSPLLDDFLEGVPDSNRRALLIELIMIDAELRRQKGESPTILDYQNRTSEADAAIVLELSTDQGLEIRGFEDAGPIARITGDVALLPEVEEPGSRNGTNHNETGWREAPAAIEAPAAPDRPLENGHGPATGDLPSTVPDATRPALDAPAPVEEPPTTIAAAPGDLEPLDWLDDVTRPGDQIAMDDKPRAGTTRETATSLAAGQMLGDYEILEKLAQGGMGIVYKAWQERLQRQVAVKTIRAGVFATERDVHLFQAEAEAIAALDHPNIVPIHEVGEHQGLRYYSMKLIRGSNLHESLPRYDRDNRAIARLVAQIAAAIEHAHQRGVLHRDLKPANILIDENGQPHVVDWGLAKRLVPEAADKEANPETRSGVGTPNYMAPEQAQNHHEAITTLTDVYGLGTILYVLLTHRPPFPGKCPKETLAKVVATEPAAPSSIDPLVDRDLETICLKCLRKAPEQRYGSARELADDLNRWLNGEPILARPPLPSERFWKWVCRHPAISLLLVSLQAAILLGLTGAGWQWTLAVAARNEARSNELAALRQAYVANLNLAGRDWSDANVAQVRKRLKTTAPRAGQPDLRGFEWHYLDHVSRGQRPPLDGHDGGARHLAFSRDGSQLASCGNDATVRLWNAADGRLIRAFVGAYRAVDTVAFHPDGSRLASGAGDGRITLWDAATGQMVRSLKGHESWVLDLAFSPDGKTLASAGQDGDLRFWTETGEPRQTVRAHPGGCGGLAYSPDGKLLATVGADGVARLWDAATAGPVRTFAGHVGSVSDVALSPDGKVLASTGVDQTLRLWDVVTGQNLRTISVDQQLVLSVAFSGDGSLAATTGSDQTVKLWNAADGRHVRTFKGHTAAVLDAAFRPGSTLLATAGGDTTIRFWDPAFDQEARTYQGRAAAVRSARFSPDGSYMAAAGEDGVVTLRDLATGQAARELAGHTGPVNAVRFSPDGKTLASAGADQQVKLWNVATGEMVHTLKRHTGPVWDVAFSPDGKLLASAGEDHTVVLWDAAAGAPVHTLRGHLDSVNCVAFSPDGKTLASGDNDLVPLVRLWDVATGREVRALKGHEYSIQSVAFSPDGTALASSGFDREIKLWDVAAGQAVQTLSGHGDPIFEVAFSPRGDRLASASADQTVRIWDVVLGQETLALKGHRGAVLTLDFSPDGMRLISGGIDRTVRLWDATAGPAPH